MEKEVLPGRARQFGLPNLAPDGVGGSGSHSLNLGEYGQLLTAREQVGRIRYPFVQDVVRDYMQPYEQGLLAEIQTEAERRTDISTRFHQYSNRVEARTGQKPSRPLACSLFIEKSICSAMDNRAIEELHEGRRGSFALWFDASAGARAALAGMPSAEIEAQGKTESMYKTAKHLAQ